MRESFDASGLTFLQGGGEMGALMRGQGLAAATFRLPFHLGIDQQERTWATNAAGDDVVRFPASDPSQVEKFKTGYSGSGLGSTVRGMSGSRTGLAVPFAGWLSFWSSASCKRPGPISTNGCRESCSIRLEGRTAAVSRCFIPMARHTRAPRSSVAACRVPGRLLSTVTTMSGYPILPARRVRSSSFAAVAQTPVHPGSRPAIRSRRRTAMWAGGGLQMQTDLAMDPAGNVWVMNNWQDIDSCFDVPPEALSTLCGGQGVTIFYGMAKPVRAPRIGPARAY